MQGDQGRRVQWAANWGWKKEENTAAAKGYGGERDGKGGGGKEGKRAAARGG